MPFRFDSFTRNDLGMEFVDIFRIMLLTYVAIQIIAKLISLGSIERILNIRTLFHIGVNFCIIFFILLAFGQPISEA